MAMWCMMNAPLMLGMDLRRLTKGDTLWQIITNRELIAINQDALGVQAKRVLCTLEDESPDKAYVTNNERADVLVKPLASGDIAISFINLSVRAWMDLSVNVEQVIRYIGDKMADKERFQNAGAYELTDVWNAHKEKQESGRFSVSGIEPYGNKTYRITPVRG